MSLNIASALARILNFPETTAQAHRCISTAMQTIDQYCVDHRFKNCPIMSRAFTFCDVALVLRRALYSPLIHTVLAGRLGPYSSSII